MGSLLHPPLSSSSQINSHILWSAMTFMKDFAASATTAFRKARRTVPSTFPTITRAATFRISRCSCDLRQNRPFPTFREKWEIYLQSANRRNITERKRNENGTKAELPFSPSHFARSISYNDLTRNDIFTATDSPGSDPYGSRARGPSIRFFLVFVITARKRSGRRCARDG